MNIQLLSYSICVISAFTVAACSRNIGIANLDYKKAYQDNGSIAIEFVSDVDFEKLFGENRVQKPVRIYLLCALADNVNFDVRRRMRFIIEGNIKIIRRASKITYRALGSPYANLGRGSEYEVIRDAEMAKIFSKKETAPCKVIITVYLSSPYYSNTMYIPRIDLKEAAQHNSDR